jgi:hypothetical protein
LIAILSTYDGDTEVGIKNNEFDYLEDFNLSFMRETQNHAVMGRILGSTTSDDPKRILVLNGD